MIDLDFEIRKLWGDNMTAKEILHDTETKMKKTVESTQREFSTIRTGRASGAILDNVRVDYYGAPTPLKQLAAVSTPEARLIVIQPWDKGALPEIEKALLKSDIGITPTNDGKVIRLTIPPLTQERRAELDKVLKKIAEDGHVSLRTARHAAIENVRKSEKDKVITEDEKFKTQDDIQKLTDKYVKEIDGFLSSKEKEISG
ncbi:MAG: ribosome recycling factor [Candidatus Omnitrophota bacterium]